MAETETKVGGKYLKPLNEQPAPWAEDNKRERIPGYMHTMGQGKKKR
jgi:hypothetical protein